MPTKSSSIPRGNPFQGQIQSCWGKGLNGICLSDGKASSARRKSHLSFQGQLLVEISEVWKVWSQSEGYLHPCSEPFSWACYKAKLPCSSTRLQGVWDLPKPERVGYLTRKAGFYWSCEIVCQGRLWWVIKLLACDQFSSHQQVPLRSTEIITSTGITKRKRCE